MRALGFLIPVVLATLVVVYYTSNTRYKHLESRAFKRQKAAYLRTHPLHSGNEAIVWTCECGHPDNSHTKGGCQVAEPGKLGACACFLNPREVRDRF